MKICFIDDNPRMTCRVMEGVKGYYLDQTGEPLECTMILVNINGEQVNTDTIKYYEDLFVKLEITMEVCESVESVETEIDQMNTIDMLFMIDLCMIHNEESMIASNPHYKTISMQVMDVLKSKNLQYKWYSGRSEENFKDPWQHRFSKLYNEKIPKIYERNDLVPACFRAKIAKEILGV